MPLLQSELIGSQKCINAFGRIFWAFIFFLDLRIGINNVHVDLLPDFIRWALIASALGWILDLHSRIKGIRTLTYWLVFLSIFDLVEIRVPLRQMGRLTVWISPMLLISIVAMVLGIIVIWRICGVIMDLAEAAGSTTMRNRADFRRKLYLGFSLAMYIAVAICLLAPVFIIPAVIIGLPVAIIVFCLMMGLMKGTQNMCRTYDAKTHDYP